MSYYQTRPLADIPRDSEVGKTIPHESAIEHVTGRALYTDDLPPRHTGVLHAWPVQVHVAHARVEEIRTGAAAALPGVVKILTSEDVPGFNDGGIKRDQPLFPSEVCMYGHPVAWVLGETEDAARKGAEAVEVDFTELPAILTPKEAIAAGSFQGSQPVLARGDIESGFAEGTTCSKASSSSAGRSTSTSRPRPRSRWSTRQGRYSSSPRLSTPPKRRTSLPKSSA